MFKFVCMYRRVDDEMALETFFSGTHLPLAEQLPGLVKSEVSRVRGKPGGESRFHLVYELYFESQADYLQAVVSETGAALAQALAQWAEAGVITWYYAESYEEEASSAPTD